MAMDNCCPILYNKGGKLVVGSKTADQTKDILGHLLGLTEEQSEVFRLVTLRGPTTAADAAKSLGRHRARGYEIFDELVQRGLMTEVPGRPVRYEVVPIRRLLAEKQSELTSRAAQLTQALNSLPADVGRPSSPHQVRLFTGTDDILMQAAALVQRAEVGVVVVGKDCFQGLHSTGLLHAIESKRNGACQVLVFLEDDSDKTVFKLVRDALGRSPIQFSAPRFPDLAGVASDQGVLFMIPESTGTEGRDGVLVESRVIGEFCCLSIKNLLHPIKSKPTAAGTEDSFLANYKQALAEAHRSIDIMVGAGWVQHWLRKDVEDLCQLYVQAMDRGVHVRILLQNSMPELLVGWEFGVIQRAQVRMASVMPLLMCIVDEEMVLKGVGTGEGDIVSSIQDDANEIRFSHEVFNRLWQISIPLEKGAPVNVGATRLSGPFR